MTNELMTSGSGRYADLVYMLCMSLSLPPSHPCDHTLDYQRTILSDSHLSTQASTASFEDYTDFRDIHVVCDEWSVNFDEISYLDLLEDVWSLNFDDVDVMDPPSPPRDDRKRKRASSNTTMTLVDKEDAPGRDTYSHKRISRTVSV